MRMYKAIFSISLFTLLIGCAGLADYDIDLPGNYSIVRLSAHQIIIAPKLTDDSWGSAVIPTEVASVGWNDDFILAMQYSMMKDPTSSNGYEIPDTSKMNYWIIDIGQNQIRGPMNLTDFDETKTKLKIPETLKLKDIDKIKK
ncbi:DUF3997 domain-containing protein [Paenibacillus sp. HJL G12]|uniref:DUF3997 domain-containing protein n=1 Tax=Paenibacillus dendrobii TaxID=2691084 RepID=A0A7X3LGP9_9BACL|nr:DUF3997 domain-containing protein [Paenibacillus dendrobii]MWV44317.1 DUF3997 domain-containing protein [Paenibacillus dendrobii]